MQGPRTTSAAAPVTKIIEAVQLAGRLAEGKQYPEEKGGGRGFPAGY